MKITGEKEIKLTEMNFELNKDEMHSLVSYADEHLSKKEIEEWKMEWAMNSILTKFVNEKSEK